MTYDEYISELQTRLTPYLGFLVIAGQGNADLNGFEQQCERSGLRRGEQTMESLEDLLEHVNEIFGLAEVAVDFLKDFIKEMEKRLEEE